jgi:hypothetical protein
MKKHSIPLFIYIFFTSIAGFSQKNDNTWVNGYRSSLDPEECGFTISFDEDTFSLSNIRTRLFLGGSAVISDSAGQLLFYSNGCYVINHQHQIIDDSLNTPGWNYDGCFQDSLNYPVFQSQAILPWPERPGLYVLLHLYKSNQGVRDRLLYSVVDMNANDGLGRVIRKNQVIIDQSQFADDLSIVRHGNGRDWWLVIGSDQTDVFTRFVLSPAGISGPQYQSVGLIAKNMGWYTQAMFSPDGTRYARVCNARREVVIMNFDRCSGLFSCLRSVSIPDADSYVGGGLCFSPNSRFVYVCYSRDVFQIDLDEEKPSRQVQHIERFDGFKSPLTTFSVAFFRMCLAPNNKIYIGAPNTNNYLHVIHQPDQAGAACQFVQRGVELDVIFDIGLNNFPNFRLYDVPQSYCDTLGIDAPPGSTPSPRWFPQAGISIIPNPASEVVYLSMEPCSAGNLRIYSLTGRLMYEISNWDDQIGVEIPVANWPSGTYVAQLYWNNYGHKQITKKFVVVH